MKPKIQEISVRVQTNEGITHAVWVPSKRQMKRMGQEPDLQKWFDDLIKACKEHYEELMGG